VTLEDLFNSVFLLMENHHRCQ